MSLRVLSLVVAALLAMSADGHVAAQTASPVTVTIAATAGGTQFALSPDASGEAQIALPTGTSVVLTAAIEGNLTAAGAYQLAIGAADGGGVTVACAAPCTSTQMQVQGQPGQRFSARATIVARGQHVANSPIVTLSWGSPAQAAAPPPRAAATNTGAAAPGKAAVVIVAGMLIVAALGIVFIGTPKV